MDVKVLEKIHPTRKGMAPILVFPLLFESLKSPNYSEKWASGWSHELHTLGLTVIVPITSPLICYPIPDIETNVKNPIKLCRVKFGISVGIVR